VTSHAEEVTGTVARRAPTPLSPSGKALELAGSRGSGSAISSRKFCYKRGRMVRVGEETFE
jgi:hypothetical protein